MLRYQIEMQHLVELQLLQEKFPELVSVFAGTALNQTGQAVEIIFITMSIYLFLSLLTSFLMNTYNARVTLVEK